MRSPCKSKCKLDPTTDFCECCGRTVVQIEQWTIYSDEQRSQIMRDLKKKRRPKNGLGNNN